MIDNAPHYLFPLRRIPVFPRQLALVAALTILAGLSVGAPVAEAQTTSTPRWDCRQVPLAEKLLMPAGVAAWSADGERLITVDLVDRRLSTVDRKGVVAEMTIAFRSGDHLELERPTGIRASESGYLLFDAGYGYNDGGVTPYRFLRLDSDLRPQDERPAIETRYDGDPPEGEAVYAFVPFGAREVIVFADVIDQATDNWVTGLVHLRDGQRREIVYEAAIDDDAIYHFLYNESSLAALSDAVFLLVLDGTPRIVKYSPVTGDVGILPKFPERVGRPPALAGSPAWEKASSSPRHERAARRATAYRHLVESAAMPVGLYAWSERLFLLAKGAIDPSGRTRWTLVEIDPTTGAGIASFELPTRAAGLIAVPGDDWALIEKGPTKPWGPRGAPYSKISQLVRFPGTWLDHTGPRLATRRPALCAEAPDR